MPKKNILSHFLKDMLFIRSCLVQPHLFIRNYNICEVTELKVNYLKVVGTAVLKNICSVINIKNQRAVDLKERDIADQLYITLAK